MVSKLVDYRDEVTKMSAFEYMYAEFGYADSHMVRLCGHGCANRSVAGYQEWDPEVQAPELPPVAAEDDKAKKRLCGGIYTDRCVTMYVFGAG